MGNISSRRPASRTTSVVGAQWDEANVLRLISENKLAPKYTDKLTHDQSAQSVECPICFLDFAVINTVHCCKQYICTDCVVQMKGTEGKGACPFCGNKEMQVSLMPVKEVKKTPPQASSTPAKNKDERSNSLSETDAQSNRSSESGRASLTYTTPEQEKKLRSLSMDETNSTSASAVATKTDRDALERQIREQRLQFDERDMAQAAQSSNRGTYFSSGSRQYTTSSANASYLRSARYRMTSTNTNAGVSGPGSPSSRFPAPAGAGTGTGTGSGNSAASGAQTGNARFVETVEGLLQARGGIGGISSLQQLEEIMLMEAIRLSMQDVPASTDEATGSTPAPPIAATTELATASAAHTPSSTGNTTAIMTAMGSPYNTVTNTSNSTPVLPRSPARTSPLPPPATQQVTANSPSWQPTRTPPRHVYRSSSSSPDSSGELEEDADADADAQYGYHPDHDYMPRYGAEYSAERGSDGDFRFSAGSDSQAGEEAGRESDMLSDEEEQLRLAMAMSLASLKTEQDSHAQEQEQAQEQRDTSKLLPADAEAAPMICHDAPANNSAVSGSLNTRAIIVDLLGLPCTDEESPVKKMPAEDSEDNTPATEQSSA